MLGDQLNDSLGRFGIHSQYIQASGCQSLTRPI